MPRRCIRGARPPRFHGARAPTGPIQCGISSAERYSTRNEPAGRYGSAGRRAHSARSSSMPSLAPEREPVPLEVPGHPFHDLEPRRAGVPLQPDRGQLGDGPPQPARFGHELDADLEAGVGVDPDLAHEVGVVGLERVRGVAGADPADPVERQPGQLRQRALERRSADLLTAAHVARRGRDHDAAVDEIGKVVDLLGIVAAVGHRDDRDRRVAPARSPIGSPAPGRDRGR